MTETASGRAGRGGNGGKGTRKGAAGGLTSQRIYTKAGVHPYDEVTWERRDVVMTNWRDGSVNFEQRGVEFPDFWSVNAANIVTTKYFRGAVGTPQREWSLKQLVDRVASVYVTTGKENSYFATDEDAEIFDHELKHALIHQVFSFNSPVWFNVGTTSPQQVSACQPYHALVSTPAGLVPIGELVEDDARGAKVYDAHGVTRIVATKANGVKDVLRLHTKAGYSLDVTADHLVWRAENLVDGRFVDAGKLRSGDRLLWMDPESGGPNQRLAEIKSAERMGAMQVYDIQTESGEYLSGNLRVHNCFILAVDDTMDSILDWYKEEGLIFKGGSGSGVNLSRIRSSKELLSSGGTASGPVSFMRGADASAGTIKSGGATRRAAKMVVLDVDHPDVGEFIETKAREEEKVRVLRDGGFDMDLGGQDITSVQYQNANNSVRVSDEFMEAVESGGQFDLLARRTGEVVERIDAKTLFRKMAQAAWECADPGIQYDGTINDWHTCPESGRITASNPCSEYIHLDNSSCNLASINLLKFLRDDDTFDTQRFARIVELIITAMDISITFADFPTQNIAETTRAYRQLGIGYANLGALLMATGHAYDSPGGRAIAAAITSLLTGTAYRRSAQLAGVVGPYDGYRRNAAAHKRVMRKHAAANDTVRVHGGMGEEILDAATTAWRECLALGEENGYRNAQSSLLAPTGCLTGDSLITTGRGLARLAELGDEYGDRWQDIELMVSTDEGPRPATRFFVNGEEPTRLIRTEGGYKVQGTLAHRVKVVDTHTGAWVWKRLADIVPGDVVPMQLGTMVGATRRVPLPVLDQAGYVGDRGLRLPDQVTPEVAELAGYFMGDGSLHAKGIRFRVADTDLDVMARLEVLVKSLFGLEPVVTAQENYRQVLLPSVRLARWWQAVGFAKGPPGEAHQGSGWIPRVPSAILETNNPDVYASFVRGLFQADGTVLEGIPSLSTAHETFAAEIRSLMLALGLATTTQMIGSGCSGPISVIRLRNIDHALNFDQRIGFIGERKASLMAELEPDRSANDYIYLPRPVWEELTLADSGRRNAVLRSLRKARRVPRILAQRVFEETLDERLGEALEYLYERIAANDDGGVRPTYDLSVPENVTYVANGMVSHNTIGLMMDCDTTGIEPDLALVKFKKLVGGGSMQIVNQTVSRALTNLGYQPEQVEAVIEYVAEHGHVVDAPGLRQEDYDVFDCAMGERAIKPMGHVRMMAAVQPFLSGAISKCVTGDTLVPSSAGLIRIGTLHRGEEEDTFRGEQLVISSLDADRKTDAFYYGGVRPVRRVRLRSGHTITGTNPHRLLVAVGGDLCWRTLGEIHEGDAVAIQYGAELWATTPASLRDVMVSPLDGSQQPVTLPGEMTGELAFLLGAYASEGHTACSNWTITITNWVPDVLHRVSNAWYSVFGLEARITADPGKCPEVVVSSKAVVEFLTALGCGLHASDKRIPAAVLMSPREMVLAFLQGLALDADVSITTAPKWVICRDSPGLLDDLQAAMTNLGVISGRVTKRQEQDGKDCGEVYAAGTQGQLMVSLVPFLEPEKAGRAAEYLGMSCQSATADVVPGLTGRELYGMIPPGTRGRNGLRSWRSDFTFLLDAHAQQVCRATIERVSTLPGVELPTWLRQVIDGNLHFSPVVSVADAGEAEVYDLSVPQTHAFVANGIVNHNTVNMPESATVEDIEHVYFEGWKLGLKALAIYRDNCKVGQPLSVAGRKFAGAEAGGHTAGRRQGPVVARQGPATARQGTAAARQGTAENETPPVRRRLPKQRTATVTSFSVGGAEGYMTASTYPGDGLGEVFLKLGKQGSTLAGVMDAFSMAISISLQYGVPLRTWVEKFTNMRFEPAGLTDDPDIRIASSVLDYIFRRLALDHLPGEERAELGMLSAAERSAQLAGEDAAELAEADPEAMAQSAPVEQKRPERLPHAAEPAHAHSSIELIEEQQGRIADAPLCLTCGTKMRPAGSCYVCEGCGSTSGCS